jgi:hypothetical protein
MWSHPLNKRAFAMLALILACAAASSPAYTQQLTALTPPSIPLTFGMNPEQVSQALGTQLYYVRGRPGDELLLALPNVKGATLASRSDGLYLQFRNGRLTGWKGDWGTIRP